MLIDTVLDLAGLDYDAVEHRLILRPVLPGPWPQTGIKQSFPCGDVSYRLERPIGGKVYHLNLKAQLKHPVTLEVELTCPDLAGAGTLASLAPDARARPRRHALVSCAGASRCRRARASGTGRGAEAGRREENRGFAASRAQRRRLVHEVPGTSRSKRQAAFRSESSRPATGRKTTPFSKSCPKSP